MRVRRRNWILADIYPKSLSLVFSFFSPFASILIGARSRGLKAGRGVAVVSHGVWETRWSLENSRVFQRLSFFFSFSFSFLFFLLFFLSQVVTVQDLGSLLKRTTSLLSLKAGRSEFYLAPYVPNYSPSLTLEMGGLLSRRSRATLTHANLRIIPNK